MKVKTQSIENFFAT